MLKKRSSLAVLSPVLNVIFFSFLTYLEPQKSLSSKNKETNNTVKKYNTINYILTQAYNFFLQQKTKNANIKIKDKTRIPLCILIITTYRVS